MSVTRFRDVADMPAPPRGDPRDPATCRRIRELWRFSDRVLPPLFAPGVYKYRSITEAETARERATLQRMRAMRAARSRPSPSGRGA